MSSFDHAVEQVGRLLASGPPVLTEESRLWMARALAHPNIRPTAISASVAQALCQDPVIAGIIGQFEGGATPSGQAIAEMSRRLTSDHLLLALMETTVVPSAPLERLFTGARRALLLDLGGYEPSPEAMRVAAALAVQAFFSSYAWFVAPEERAAIERLVRSVEQDLAGTGAIDPLRILLIGAYRPLHELKEVDRLAERAWPKSLDQVIRIQLIEPLQERALRAQIPRLTPIRDEVSQRVREQYEEDPYPHWIRAGRTPEPMPLPDFLRGIGADLPTDPSFARPDVLVAGCGTGQQSVFAASFYKDATILAVDLSLASLAYAIRKSHELGFPHIDYRQADILELATMERQFHVIECVGVLHHLADPIAGWRVLAGRLRRGGLMHVALYSELARRGVVMARAQIADAGYLATRDDIRRFRQYVLGLPEQHPLAGLRNTARDFFNLSECRDLLFHVHEQRFTIPRIRTAITELGLRFLGFRSLHNADVYRRLFPRDERMISLDHWQQFEQTHPDTFVAMYDFWVQKC